MEIMLGVTTCDKCGKPMTTGQKIITIGQSTVTNSNSEIEATSPEISYACHIECWDMIEEG
jgi:hypothetical protein